MKFLFPKKYEFIILNELFKYQFIDKCEEI